MAEFERLHAGNTEVQEKQSIAFDYAQTATVGLAATGVLTGMLVNQTTTASGSVVIGAGAGVVGSTVGAGASQAVNPGDVTFDVFTLNPVGGLPRNDIIVWDSATRLLAVVAGTPNATPSDPTVANTQLKLGRLRHAASATTIPLAKIDDLRVFTSLFGIAAALAAVAAEAALARNADNLTSGMVAAAHLPATGANMGTPVSTASDGTTATNAWIRDDVLGNYVFTALAGRRYEARVNNMHASSTVAGDMVLFAICNGGASTPTPGSGAVAMRTVQPVVGLTGHFASSVDLCGSFVPGAGVQTLAVCLIRVAGSGTITPWTVGGFASRELYVVDLGPA